MSCSCGLRGWTGMSVDEKADRVARLKLLKLQEYLKPLKPFKPLEHVWTPSSCSSLSCFSIFPFELLNSQAPPSSPASQAPSQPSRAFQASRPSQASQGPTRPFWTCPTSRNQTRIHVLPFPLLPTTPDAAIAVHKHKNRGWHYQKTHLRDHFLNNFSPADFGRKNLGPRALHPAALS